MSRENELIKNTVVLGIGKLLPKFVATITLPIITAQLTKAEYGTYDLISTLVMLVLPIATLQIQSAAFRFLIDCRGDKRKSTSIISNIFVVTVPISVIVSFVIGMVWSDMTILNRVLFCTYLVADILYNTISQITRGLSFNKYYSISSIVLSVINCVCIVATLQVVNLGLSGAIFSLVVADIVAIVYLGKKIKIFTFLNFDNISISVIKKMISYSWPMIPNNLSNWVLKLSDRLIITAVLGVEANAVYAVANKIPNLLSIAQSIFVMAWQENASIVVGDKDAEIYYSTMFERVLSIMFGSTAVLVGLTPVIFKLLIRGDYDAAYIQIPILILGMFFYCMSAFQGGIYVAHKKTKSVGITTVVAAGVNLLIDILFVNLIGITAGSISTLVAYFLLYLYRLIGVQKFQKMKYHIPKQIVYLSVLCVMLFLCYLRNIWLNYINGIIGIIACMLSCKELLCELYRKVKLENEKRNRKF